MNGVAITSRIIIKSDLMELPSDQHDSVYRAGGQDRMRNRIGSNTQQGVDQWQD